MMKKLKVAGLLVKTGAHMVAVDKNAYMTVASAMLVGYLANPNGSKGAIDAGVAATSVLVSHAALRAYDAIEDIMEKLDSEEA